MSPWNDVLKDPVTASPKPPDSLSPAAPYRVLLGLTVLYTVLYVLLFTIVFLQLWMIYCFKHRLLSFQTAFLFLCLLWSALRVELFSFYFRNCDLANRLSCFWYWLLYCCPLCVQFVILCLLVTFFSQVVYRTHTSHSLQISRHCLLVGIVVVAIIVFLATNITCAILVNNYRSRFETPPLAISVARVSINDSLFLLLGAMLSVFIYRVGQISTVSVVLEAKGTTKCQAIAASIVIVVLFISRAVYNLVAICDRYLFNFGYGWINVTDQADIVNLNEGFAYVSFGIVLFVWEFLPTLAVVLFFRVTIPRALQNPGIVADNASDRRDFFSNLHRYDSDDEVERDLSYSNARRWSSPRGSFVTSVNNSSPGSFIPYTSGTAYGTFPGSSSPLVHGVSTTGSSLPSVRVKDTNILDSQRNAGHASPDPYYNGT